MKEQMEKQLGIKAGGAGSGDESGSGSGSEEEEPEVKVYQSGQLTSTVTVTAIHNSDRWAGWQEVGDGLLLFPSLPGRRLALQRPAKLRSGVALGSLSAWPLRLGLAAHRSGAGEAATFATSLLHPVPPCWCSEAEEAGEDEEGGSRSGSDDDTHEPAAAGAAGGRQHGGAAAARQQQQQRQQAARRQQGGGGSGGGGGDEGGQPHKKMSKHALRVMAKTKAKLEGKKGRGREAGFAKNLASKKRFKGKKK